MSFDGLEESLHISKDVVNSFDCDILKMTIDETFQMTFYMFEKFHLIKEFDIDLNIFHEFIYKLKEGYNNDLSYHNWYHAVDVTHTVYRLLDITHSG